jgi:hypothetical protein
MPDLGQVTGVIKQVVAIGPDGRVYHRVQKTDSSWTPFAVVPGRDAIPSGIIAKRVAIAGARDGSAQIVVVGEDDTVYHTVRFANGTWQAQGFAPVASGNAWAKARDVAISIGNSSSSSPGIAQIVASSLDIGEVYHIIRSPNGWSAWTQLPGSAAMNAREVAIAVGQDGNTYVLATAVQPDGTVQIKRQARYAGSSWWDSSFVTVATPPSVTLGPKTDIALTLTPGPNGTVLTAQLVYTDNAGATWFQERGNPINQPSWTGQVSNALVANSGSRAVSISAQPSSGGPSEVTIVRTSPQ